MQEDKKPNNKIAEENIVLKSKIAYSIGSLETVNYLLKNEDPDTIVKNMEHLKSIVSRILDDLKRDII